MKRSTYTDEHEAFRASVRAFIEKEVVPHQEEWDHVGHAPAELYVKLSELGVTGFDIPEEYGGVGPVDFRYHAVLAEEAARAAVWLGNYSTSWGIVLPYLLRLATEEQKARWLPGIAEGRTLLAVAMSEPGTGSDLAAIRTTAVRDGDVFVLNGAKTFITGGSQADRIIVVARTAKDPDDRRAGLTLFVLDTSLPGFSVGRRLDKIGLKSRDTCELAFEDIQVPADCVLGEEGRAFGYLSANLPRERLSVAVTSVATAEAAIEMTKEYVTGREVFGQHVSDFQNTKFTLAECRTQVTAAQAMIDRAIELERTDELTAADAAECKLFCTEMAGRVIDECLQLHGGYGYILEYPIARMYADTRVTRIFAGTSEVMKVIIARSMGL